MVDRVVIDHERAANEDRTAATIRAAHPLVVDVANVTEVHVPTVHKSGRTTKTEARPSVRALSSREPMTVLR
jgi:hypothetical protein